MGFSEAVQWWDEWQLRLLALGSLFLQYFLFIAAALRKRQTPAWFKFITWLAYLGSDALAIYALATLFNRHKTQEWISTHRSSASLEALWAPVLLLHLGGQDGITAYNIEDNELWRRHVVTAVSQVTVAIYVFRKSWSGDKRLLQAAILFFVPGILKCFEKPWALMSASINSLVKTSSSNETSGINPLDKYIKDATKYIRDGHSNEPHLHKPYELFVDLAYPYSVRLNNLKYMLHKRDEAHNLLQSGLSKTFDRFYTKEEMNKGLNACPDLRQYCALKTWCGWFLRTVIIYLTFPAIGLFHKSHREAYNDTDVKVTYTLLCCTAALEYIAQEVKGCTECFECILGPPWPDQVAQYNLIGYFVRNKKLGKLTSLPGKDYIDQLWCMKPCKSSGDITKLVHDHIKEGWEQCIKDITSYRAFNDFRGQWTLRREECSKDMEWSLTRPFDESVLLWHLATDFCFYYTSSAPPENETARRCREMSNYMAYLLFVNPEMLMAGARSSLFRVAYGELKGMMSKEKLQPDETEPTRKKTPLDEGKLAEKIIRQVKDRQVKHTDYAWQLAEELMGLGEEKMWRVIKGVWVEMLCFSAGRCRGYLHAKSLSNGGEYLTYVWLLLSYMGMETLGERMQRTELPDEGDKGTADPIPATATTEDDIV